jgi:hypothetical protein
VKPVCQEKRLKPMPECELGNRDVIISTVDPMDLNTLNYDLNILEK